MKSFLIFSTTGAIRVVMYVFIIIAILYLIKILTRWVKLFDEK